MKQLKVLLIVLAAFNSSACASLEKTHLGKADDFSYKSELFFQKAVSEYEKALKESSDDAAINFKLAKLYFNHGNYQKCAGLLLNQNDTESKKLLAFSFFKMADYTSALSLFNEIGSLEDDGYLFYYAQTCERQNLFDQAKKLYSKIKSREYLSLAKTRLQAIDASLKGKELSTLNSEVLKIINGAPAQDAFPQAGALTLLADEAIEVLPNDTQVTTAHYIIKILNERGKKSGEVDIDYDSTFEKVELDFARTIKPDAEVAVVGSKHIRDVSRYLNFPLYSNARAMIISMPEVAVGSVIEYKLKITRSQLVNKKDFYSAYLLQNDEPVLHAKLSVAVPNDRALNIKFINAKYNYYSAVLEPKIIQLADKKIYNWEFKNIPQIIPEPLMPPVSEIDATILLSTFRSWDGIYKWWWQLAKDKIEANDKMKEKVLELTKNLKTDIEKARSIYNWCTQNIRYVAIEYGQAGFEPHRATDIFANKYGDCKDQAILLISLLKEAGLKAYPVLIGTKDNFKLIEDFPMLLFNHAIAAVDIEGELIFLDPTAETTSFGDLPSDDQDRRVLVFLENRAEIVLTPDFKAEHNSLETMTTFNIKSDESIFAERSVLTEGFFDQGQRYHLRYTQPILFEEDLKEKVHSITPGGKLLNYKIENLDNLDKPIKLTYSFSGPELLTKAGQARVIPQLGDVDLSVVAKDSREFPIDFGSLSHKETRMSFKLPESLKVKFLPQTVKFNTKWLSYLNSYTQEDSRIVFRQNTTLKQKVISQSEYKFFKAALEQLSRKVRQCIVLERQGP